MIIDTLRRLADVKGEPPMTTTVPEPVPYVLLLVAVASVVGLVLLQSFLFGALGIASVFIAMLLPVSDKSAS